MGSNSSQQQQQPQQPQQEQQPRQKVAASPQNKPPRVHPLTAQPHTRAKPANQVSMPPRHQSRQHILHNRPRIQTIQNCCGCSGNTNANIYANHNNNAGSRNCCSNSALSNTQHHQSPVCNVHTTQLTPAPTQHCCHGHVPIYSDAYACGNANFTPTNACTNCACQNCNANSICNCSDCVKYFKQNYEHNCIDCTDLDETLVITDSCTNNNNNNTINSQNTNNADFNYEQEHDTDLNGNGETRFYSKSESNQQMPGLENNLLFVPPPTNLGTLICVKHKLKLFHQY